MLSVPISGVLLLEGGGVLYGVAYALGELLKKLRKKGGE